MPFLLRVLCDLCVRSVFSAPSGARYPTPVPRHWNGVAGALKRYGSRMMARQIAEGHRHESGDERRVEEGEDDSGPGDFERGRGSKQQAGADRSADRDHRHLPGGELTLESALAVGRVRGLHRGCISEATLQYKDDAVNRSSIRRI